MAKGNGPIQYNELFASDVNSKISELQGMVSELDSDFQSLSTTIKAMSGTIKVNIKGNSDSLRELATNLSKSETSARGMADALDSASTTLATTAKQTDNLKDKQKGLDDIFEISTASVNELNARIKLLTAEYNALGRATDADKQKANQLTNELKALKTEQTNLSAAIRNTNKTLSQAEGSYSAISKRLNDLRRDLRELPNSIDKTTGAFNKANPAVRKYLEEINRLDTVLKKADASTGQHQRNVGNYAGALQGAGQQLATLAAGYLSIQGAMELAGRSFDSALQTDAIRTVLEFTFQSADVANQKLIMLRATADRLGVSYIDLANSYKSFTAAAIASNFPIDQSEKIFNAVANAGAKMKLSSDQMSGALLALQQMISKGNVQAEELRGQLAERLPGAFAIAARAMGVTESQLNKMLKDGDVLAADLLPRLAIELDKTFGNDQTQKIDSLQASWGRLKNTFDLTVEASGVSKFFKALIDGTNSWLSSIKTVINSSSWKEFFVNYFDYSTGGLLSSIKAVINSSSWKEFFVNYFDYSTGGLFKPKSNTIINGPVKALPGGSGDIGIGGIFNVQSKKEKTLPPILGGNNKEKQQKQKTALEELKEQIDKITLSLNLQALAAAKAQKAYTPDQESLNKLKELEDLLYSAMNLGRMRPIERKGLTQQNIQVTGGNISWVDDLEKLQSVDRAKAEAPLLSFSELLDKVAKADAKGQQDLTKVYSDEIDKRLQKTEQAKEAFRNAIDFLRINNQALADLFGQEFGNLFNELTTTLEDFVTSGSVGFEQLANVAIGSVRAINESYQQGTALRIEALQLEKQAQIDIAGTNKDARLNIEKEYNDRIRAEKIKQARLDKTAAVFEIGINTAIAASKVLGQTGIAGIPLVPIVVAFGLAQIAAVLARPIPQFRHGTQNSPEGLAEVAEDGAEAIQSPSGKMRIAHKRQITYLEKGSKVFTAAQTKKMLETGDIDRQTELHGKLAINMQNAKRDEAVKTMALAMYQSRVNPEEIGESVGQAVGRLPLTQWNVDENGFTRKIRKGNTTTEYLNNRYKL